MVRKPGSAHSPPSGPTTRRLHTYSKAAHPDYSELQTWHTVDCETNRPRGLAAMTDSTQWSSTNLTSCSAPFPLPVVPINQIIQQQLHNPVLLKALVELQQDFPTDRWLCSTRDSTSSCMIGNVTVIRLGLLAHTERGRGGPAELPAFASSRVACIERSNDRRHPMVLVSASVCACLSCAP